MVNENNLEIFCKDLQSPEGPSFNREGILFFVDWDAQDIYKVTRDGSRSLFVHTGGMPNGSKFHRNGDLYVTDCDLGILKITPQGEMSVAADEYQGVRFKGPNDLIFAANGDIYFTDPRGSDPEHPIGKVFILRSSGEVELFAGGFQFPNGIVFSEDGKTLFLAETFTNRILAFELDEAGYEKSRREFVRLEGGIGPDGMAFGMDGNLFVAHYGKGVVAVVSPQGEVIQELEVGGINPTNLAFWDGALYVTEVSNSQVVKLDVGVDGQLLFGLS